MKKNIFISFLFFIITSGCVFSGASGSSTVCTNQKPSAEMRMSYLNHHQELQGTGIYYLIEDGVVDKGMTKDQVQATWGIPDRKFTSKKYGGTEVWYYYCNWKSSAYVYFKDGVVVGRD